MVRHPINKNLTLHFHPNYRGFPVQTAKGPLISEYLDCLQTVIEKSLLQYRRVFAFRLDLRFPSGQYQGFACSNDVIERFIASVRAKVKCNRQKAREANRYAHDTTVRYVWCREQGALGGHHYHLVILLNNDAFCSLGCFEMGRSNLFNRLHEAWASAIGLNVESVVGLVELPDNPFYRLHREDPQSVAALFYRASYLCKAETKSYGYGLHGFGSSRT